VQLTLRLELKLIADVGLVGKPNAGKSTLLARISAATPKIADYPFTTRAAHLGIVDLAAPSGRPDAARRLVVADIPGLIENAHRGAGLGSRFLRHIERTGVLVHLVEPEPADGADPADNYRAVREELAAYGATLAAKPQLVVLSKMDLYPNEHDQRAAVELVEQAICQRVYPISAVTGQGVRDLVEACWQLCTQQGGPVARDRQEADGWSKSIS
jgi:GTP-binding protein